MKGLDVATATSSSRFLRIGDLLLRRHVLRSAIRTRIGPCEALADERVDIDAQIEPAIPFNHHVWNADMRL